MFALLAFIVFVIAACRDYFATRPEHQGTLLYIGLALVALDLAWAIALPRVPARRRPAPVE